MNIFDSLIVYPLINVLLLCYQIVFSLHIPYALGFSIILLTVVIRLILYPLTGAQLKASKKMMDLNPHLKNLKEKHKGDAKTLQAETMRLYKEHGVNPAAGCLPVLIQMPVIFGLYSVLNKIIHLGAGTVTEINKIVYFDFLQLSKVWDTTFFGIPLGQSPSTLYKALPLLLLVPILTGIFQFIQSKMMLPAVSAADKKITKAKSGEKKSDDFATAFQSQSLYIFPFMIAFFSWGFPIGLSLYWNTFTIFGIIQQHRVSGLGGLKEWKDKINGKK